MENQNYLRLIELAYALGHHDALSGSMHPDEAKEIRREVVRRLYAHANQINLDTAKVINKIADQP